MTDPKPDLKSLIAKVAERADLAEAEAERAFDVMMSGEASPAQIGAFLMGLRVKGETVGEITGAARAMRGKMTTISAPDGAMDVVGTGGDGAGTYNVSTAAAIVVAGCGVPVAKHGNRAFSSKSGAADVLAALGLDLQAEPARVEQAVRTAGIGFLMAPIYHSAMRHVGPTRAELGIRTVFNILGPLCNPAGVRRLMVGTFDVRWTEPMAQVLGNLGAERAWVVHGHGGLDEMTTTGPTEVAELRDGKVRRFTVTPEDAGLPRTTMEHLRGGDPKYNADAIRALLGGKRTPYRDIVLLNAGAALVVAGQAADLRDGVARAAVSIDEGKAAAALAKLVETVGAVPA
ncbi:MAG: anthranilate phosphoribosyltransferase [Alphaproteobacteria bacterium]